MFFWILKQIVFVVKCFQLHVLMLIIVINYLKILLQLLCTACSIGIDSMPQVYFKFTLATLNFYCTFVESKGFRCSCLKLFKRLQASLQKNYTTFNKFQMVGVFWFVLPCLFRSLKLSVRIYKGNSLYSLHIPMTFNNWSSSARSSFEKNWEVLLKVNYKF